MKTITCIKLKPKMFDSAAVREILSTKGMTIFPVYAAILSKTGLSGSGKHGVFVFYDTFPFSEESLADEFDLSIESVSIAVRAFKNANMLTVFDVEVSDTMDKKPQEAVRENFSDEIEEIVAYLNQVCSTSYRANTEQTRKHITARLKEGYTVEDFKAVIQYKANEWGRDEHMTQYLRPHTLFSGKFESYLQNAKKFNPELFRKRGNEKAEEAETEISVEEWLKI